jgi:3-deoxy-manno-octulosonate cytidylyltransferase (CMP-KDO synthetase)
MAADRCAAVVLAWHNAPCMKDLAVSRVSPRVLGVIPARLESVRLPRKPLRQISGHPMIAWVYHRARQSPSLSNLLIATDSQEIVAYCQAAKIPVELTSSDHRSGTDRLVEVMRREPADIYVNIQGDEPMVTARHIELLLAPFREDPVTQVSTLKIAMGADAARDPNNVKVVTDAHGQALYFSRSPIPHNRDAAGHGHYYKHLGIYAYSPAALEKFSALPPASLEQLERLEQLRFLENGVPIAVVETAEDTIGVDSEENLRQVENYFERNGIRLFPG